MSSRWKGGAEWQDGFAVLVTGVCFCAKEKHSEREVEVSGEEVVDGKARVPRRRGKEWDLELV